MSSIAYNVHSPPVISFYSSTVFVRSGYTEEKALFASLGFGALNFVFAIPAVFLVDTFGRRSLLLSVSTKRSSAFQR